MKKYYLRMKNKMGVELEYRFNILGEVLIQLISMGGFIVLWMTIYKEQGSMGDFTKQDITVYYFLIPLISLVTDTQISRVLGRDIKDGFISTEIAKPQIIWLTYLFYEIGRKVYNLTIVLVTYFFLFILLNTAFLNIKLGAEQILLSILFLICGLALSLSMDFVIGFLAFWIDDTWSFKHFKTVLNSILGGRAFPFSFLTAGLRTVFMILPFQFFFFIPLSYFLGDRGRSELLSDMGILLIWFLIFAVLSVFLWKLGIKKYGAYGN